MEVDIALEPDLTPSQVAELAQAAERYGIRALWTSNYYDRPDAFLSLAQAAAVTERLLLGPLAISPFEMHPLKIANAMLTFNEMCGGRAVIVIGAGEGVTDAIAYPKPQRLVRAVREAVEIVAGAANGTLGRGYRGEIFEIVWPFRHRWATTPGAKVYTASMGPQMIRMGARVADGMQLGDMPIERMPDVMVQVQAGWDKRGHAPADFHIGNFFGWHVLADREAAYRQARREIAWRGRMLHDEFICHFLEPDQCQLVREKFGAFQQAWVDRSGDIQGVPEEIVNALIHGMTATGDHNDLDREIERFRRFAEFGVTEMVLRLYENPMESLALIGERVVPALR